MTTILALLASMTAAACGSENGLGSGSGGEAGGSSGSAGGATSEGTYGTTYADCYRVEGNASSGGSVTVGESDGLTVVSYSGGGDLPDFSLTLASTSYDSATLSPAGQEVTAYGGECSGLAPVEEGLATVRLSSGTLTVDKGAAFLSLVGTIVGVQSSNCSVDPRAPQVTLAISCQVPGQVSP